MAKSDTASTTTEPDSRDAPGPDFSSYPPIYVFQTHLSIESLHAIEEELTNHNARLTYDIDEARLMLGKISQAKRAALELRALGLWTEAITGGSSPPAKRRRIEPAAIASPESRELIDLNTETEDENEVEGQHGSSRHLVPRDPTAAEQGIITVLNLTWLEQSIQRGTLLPEAEYTVYHARRIERPAPPQIPQDPPSTQKGKSTLLQRAKADTATTTTASPTHTKPPETQPQHHPRTKPTHPPPKLYRTTTSEADDLATLPEPPDWVKTQSTYSCTRSTPLHPPPPNADFISELADIRLIRELTLDDIGVRAYSTAIAAIAAYPYPLRRPAEVLRLPGCDAKIAGLFFEFQERVKGKLSEARPLSEDPTLSTLHTFYNIWGVGAKTAREFYFQRGWRDLDDVVEHGWGALTRVQQIGVKYYDEFLAGIPREEVEGIAAVVKRHAALVDEDDEGEGQGVECIITGSHRRGKPVSGDVDLILSHRDDSMTKNLVVDVLRSLEAEGWITHTLVLHQGSSAREQQTAPYRGDSAGSDSLRRKMFDSLDKGLVVWQCPYYPSRGEGERNPNPHRRVDIIISPWRTVGCAVLGWSGDKTFERDLRRIVKKERGWKFDSSGVRERTSGGRVIDLESAGETWEERERLVMEGLGIGWRPPEERCTR
ncbi:type-X family DNA polymerase [Aspergillus homomorphus CBS 101889]|uniref:Terminal deoxynucleotidyl transferase n=1 Tax=Aspergillus homomorphus (strain CBS 101889) TaxID=1450537 RepID=A0A395I5F6_ASPHC|nr:terminal deoxynucleotidyl transferase [Aspergillus homomorphus CBS 101889]RAL15227.1 terminal deoxynucleotidyl transferase [Aspergillus homomorphus CBS 101889]